MVRWSGLGIRLIYNKTMRWKKYEKPTVPLSTGRASLERSKCQGYQSREYRLSRKRSFKALTTRQNDARTRNPALVPHGSVGSLFKIIKREKRRKARREDFRERDGVVSVGGCLMYISASGRGGRYDRMACSWRVGVVSRRGTTGCAFYYPDLCHCLPERPLASEDVRSSNSRGTPCTPYKPA